MTIVAPTLWSLHGAEDQLLSVAHGEHTAQIIPGARFKVYRIWAITLPESIVPELVERYAGAP